MSYGGGYPPPQGHSPYPPQGQGQYPPPGQPPGQQPYQQPPQGYPPQQGHSPYPPQGPPGQYGAPQGYPPPGGPSPGQYGAPQGYPPQGYPPQGYPPQGAPQGYPQGPPQGYPPQGGYPQASYGPPAPASIGYEIGRVANVDTSRDTEALHKSMKGMGTDEKGLIAALVRVPDPYVMAAVRRQYQQRFLKDLLAHVSSETSRYFGETCEALVRGPLEQDVWNLNDSLAGAGTKESALNDVLLGRSNADLRAIKQEYQRTYKRALEADVAADLSMKTEKLFAMVLAATRAEESTPVLPHDTDRDVSDLHRATVGVKFGADAETVCHIFSARSDGQLRAISLAYNNKYKTPLAKVIEKEFHGHMEDALLRMLTVGEDRAMADAQALEDSMKGMGTKDRLLLNRLARLHWDKAHFGQVKGAYRHRFKKDLAARVKGETSGDYQRVLLAIIG